MLKKFAEVSESSMNLGSSCLHILIPGLALKHASVCLVSGMLVWVPQWSCAQLQWCTSGWRSFTHGGLRSGWLFYMKPAPSQVTRCVCVLDLVTKFFLWVCFPLGGTRDLFMKLYLLTLLPPLCSLTHPPLEVHDTRDRVETCTEWNLCIFTSISAVAGTAHSRDSSVSWYPDHLLFSCEDYAGRLATIRLALHHTGWGP